MEAEDEEEECGCDWWWEAVEECRGWVVVFRDVIWRGWDRSGTGTSETVLNVEFVLYWRGCGKFLGLTRCATRMLCMTTVFHLRIKQISIDAHQRHACKS